jgi:DNA-binding MarR family transcriptional regulator
MIEVATPSGTQHENDMRRSAATRASRIAHPAREQASENADAPAIGGLKNPMNEVITYKIKRLQHALMTELDDILRRYKLRPMDCAILSIVSANPGVHQGGVANLLGMEPPAVVLASDRLEAAGLLARHFDPNDRRMRALYLTPAGTKLLPLVMRDVNVQERKIKAAIQSTHLGEFNNALDRLMRAYFIIR